MQVSQFFDTGLQPAHCPLVAIGQIGGSCSAWAGELYFPLVVYESTSHGALHRTGCAPQFSMHAIDAHDGVSGCSWRASAVRRLRPAWPR